MSYSSNPISVEEKKNIVKVNNPVGNFRIYNLPLKIKDNDQDKLRRELKATNGVSGVYYLESQRIEITCGPEWETADSNVRSVLENYFGCKLALVNVPNS